jgi:hypothetical protein
MVLTNEMREEAERLGHEMLISQRDGLQVDRDQLLAACKMAYLKHHMGDTEIGNNRLSYTLSDVLTESMGHDEFCDWVDRQQGRLAKQRASKS